MKYLFLTFLFSLSISLSTGQESGMVETINYYADVVANAHEPNHRSRAQKDLKLKFEEWIQSGSFSRDQLSQIQYMSVKTPADDAFTIVTWQLVLENDHDYFGYLFTDSGFFKLEDKSDDLYDIEYEELSVDRWYGALYYNIYTTPTNEYILFGYNGYRDFDHQKIAEVLTFKDGVPSFGAPIFKKDVDGHRPEIRNRLLLTYTNDANVTINFNEGLNMITLDHLIRRNGRQPGQGPTWLPDGSYVGYQWNKKENKFDYIDKIYNQISATPPMPKPVIGEKKKDIFGRESKR